MKFKELLEQYKQLEDKEVLSHVLEVNTTEDEGGSTIIDNVTINIVLVEGE